MFFLNVRMLEKKFPKIIWIVLILVHHMYSSSSKKLYLNDSSFEML